MAKNPPKMVFPLLGSIINVQAYKYNGELYKQWNGVKVLRNTDNQYVLFLHKTRVAETRKKSWTYREPAIWFIPKHSDYNALVLLRSKNNYIYVNMASKPIYEDNTIKFVDFDLDVKNYPRREIQIADKDEFRINSKLYKYPPKLIKKIQDSLAEVLSLVSANRYFFNDKIVEYYVNELKKDKSLMNDFRIAPKKFINDDSADKLLEGIE